MLKPDNHGKAMLTATGSIMVIQSHHQAPRASNNFSICPVLEAEAILNSSPARMAIEGLKRWPTLNSLVAPYLAGEPGSTLVIERAVVELAGRVFRHRMREAARDTAMQGFSEDRVPRFLTSECFQRPPPDGLRLPAYRREASASGVGDDGVYRNHKESRKHARKE